MLGKVTMAATLAVGTDAMATHGRQLSQIPVGKYSPSTNVMDHASMRAPPPKRKHAQHFPHTATKKLMKREVHSAGCC
jgi:hypothetical protein